MSAAVAPAVSTNLATNSSAHNSPMDAKKPSIKMDNGEFFQIWFPSVESVVMCHTSGFNVVVPFVVSG